jgi:Trm5-related predicted tRNA methylase
MDGLDICSAILAVATAFHAGADLMREIRKRRSRKRRGSEQAAREKMVQDTLEEAETQVSKRYDDHFKELGDQFKFGDGRCLVESLGQSRC